MILPVLVRVVLSVSANAVQKRLLLDGASTSHVWILTYGLMLGPAVLLAIPFAGADRSAFWGNVFLGGALDAIGNLAMVAALRTTDLSIFGPLNAFRPIIALGLGWVLLGEQPSGLGLAGIAVTVFGGVILFSGQPASPDRPAWQSLWRPLALRAAGITLGVVGAVFLKRAALASSAMSTVAAWIFCGLLVLAAFAAWREPGRFSLLPASWRAHGGWLAIHAGIFISMQWLTIRIFQSTLLAYSFVLFQLGMVLQVVLGRVWFDEPFFRRRAAAAVIMTLGSLLVLWKG